MQSVDGLNNFKERLQQETFNIFIYIYICIELYVYIYICAVYVHIRSILSSFIFFFYLFV